MTYVDGSTNTPGSKPKSGPPKGNRPGIECLFCSQSGNDKNGHTPDKCPALLKYQKAHQVSDGNLMQSGVDRMRELNSDLIAELLDRPFHYPTLANLLPEGADFVPPSE